MKAAWVEDGRHQVEDAQALRRDRGGHCQGRQVVSNMFILTLWRNILKTIQGNSDSSCDIKPFLVFVSDSFLYSAR